MLNVVWDVAAGADPVALVKVENRISGVIKFSLIFLLSLIIVILCGTAEIQ
jgi:hypothetical protein